MTPSWRSVPLRQAIESAQSGFASGARDPNGVIQIRMNNVTTDGNLDWGSFIRVPATPRQLAKYRLQPGDVLFNATNSPELVGKTAAFDGHSEAVVFSNHFVRLRVAADRLDPWYLARWLTYRQQQRVFEGLCTRWVNQASVRKDDLLSLRIPLPPLPEQKRIAAILAKADRLRRLRRYALDLSDTYLQSVFLEMFGDLYGNPKRWSFKMLGSIADVVSGVTKGRRFGDRETLRLPYLRVANVQDGYLDLAEIKTIEALPSDLERYRLEAGDVLMTEGGDFDKLGRGAIWRGQIEDCIHQNHIFRVRLDREQAFAEFFASLLLTRYAKGYFLQASKQTTNLATINKTQLRGFPVPLPPLALQKQFVHIVHKSERLRAQQREAERQAEHLFQTLLHQAFQGKL